MTVSARLLPFQRACRLPKAGMVGLSVLSGMAHRSFSYVRSSPRVSVSVAGMENGDVWFGNLGIAFGELRILFGAFGAGVAHHV